MHNEFTAIFEAVNLLLVFKIVTLIILFLYLIFSFLLLTQVKALNRLVTIRASQASRVLFIFALVYFMVTFSLFLVALVIL